MNPICKLPKYLTESTLYSAIHFQPTSNVKPEWLIIKDKKWELPLLKKDKAVIRFNWEKVVYFDDSTLLQLLLIHHQLIRIGLKVTHFPSNTNEQNFSKKGTHRKKIRLRPHVFRQLYAVGYFKQWIAEDFLAPINEAQRLSSITPVLDIGPLNLQHEILPIISCQSEHRLLQGSTEDIAIRKYEEDIAIKKFIGTTSSSTSSSTEQFQIVASGEFAQLILGQCRKNVIEHADERMRAMSLVRVFRAENFKSDWGLNIDECKQDAKTTLLDFIGTLSEDVPVLDIITIDDGCGIHKSLSLTWSEHILSQTAAYMRVVSSINADWPLEAQTIEFAFDKNGSRKSKEWRSIEDSGLNRIDTLVSNYGGLVELTSGNDRVVHTANEKPSWNRVDRPWQRGTLIRILFPLRETEVTQHTSQRPKTDGSVIVSADFSDSKQTGVPSEIHIISFRELWDETYSKNASIMSASSNQKVGELTKFSAKRFSESQDSPQTIMKTIFPLLRKRIEHLADYVKLAILDWAELNVSEHDTSRFFEYLRESFMNGHPFRIPCIHINFPKELLILAKQAIDQLSEDPPIPTCLYVEGGAKWQWIGISVHPSSCDVTDYVLGQPYRNPTGDPESYDEQYIRTVFDSIFTGTRRIPKFEVSLEARIKLLDYIEFSSLFFEEESYDISTGDSARSANFRPIVSLDKIQRKISETFTMKLREAIVSDACAFPPSSQKSLKNRGRRKKKPEYVKLPNGRIVSVFYRCEGLLYHGQKVSEPERSNKSPARIWFRDSLANYLVDVAKEIESHSPGQFDIVVSCTSPTHWFVHQLADGLSDSRHSCGHFVAKTRRTFRQEFNKLRLNKNMKALVFSDVISTGRLVGTIIDTLKAADVKVEGLIVIVDTRTAEERGPNTIDGKFLSLIDQRNQAFLVRLPVEKMEGVEPKWRINSETLEPVEIRTQLDWKEGFSGMGELAVSGEEVIRWLRAFGAFHHGHYKHGNRHSEFVCDVKHLFQRPEIQMYVGARLQLYIRTHEIHLVVYPNHSNAYILGRMARDLFESEETCPPHQVALCRDFSGERTYILPMGATYHDPKRILLLDDGIGSGATLRSMISACIKAYPRLEEIHVVVFSNEMTPNNSDFWKLIGVPERMSGQKGKRRKRHFSKKGFHFNSLISIPIPWYIEDNCPLCIRQREFERNSRDDNRSNYEREFYRRWESNLAFRDLYHDPDDISFHLLKDRISIQRAQTQRSKHALEVAKFFIKIKKGSRLDNLVYDLQIMDMPDKVKIPCLKNMLSLRGSVLSEEDEKTIWNRMIEIINSGNTDHSDRLSAIRALIWEQASPPTAENFWELLKGSAPHLADPDILGGTLAFGRLAVKPGKYLPPWDKKKSLEELDQIAADVRDEGASKGLAFVKNWFSRVIEAPSIGGSLLDLKRALEELPGHINTLGEIDKLEEYLWQIGDDPKLEGDRLKQLESTTHSVIHSFERIERAARALSYYSRGLEENIDQDAFDELRSRLSEIRKLFDLHGFISDKKRIQSTVAAAGSAVQFLKSMWFSQPRGYIRLLIESHFHSLLKTVNHAISRAKSRFSSQYPGIIVKNELA